MDLAISTDWSCHGLRAVILENRWLRVVVLPEAGGKVWQVTHKPTDADLLWNNPRSAPARLPMNSRYDDVWCGGWDELFPNDEAGAIDGEFFPDHGELWTGQWQAEPFRRDDAVGVTLRFTTPISAISFEKTLTLARDASRIACHHEIRNVGTGAFPFLWKLHPAFAVSPQHRLDFPPMQVVAEPAAAGSLAGAPPRFDWPRFARADGRSVDLRQVSPCSARELYFFYGADVAAGWCAITNTASRVACALTYDTAVFPHCWLFASYGGWRSHYVAVLEPCTGYPVNFDALRAAGRHRTLAPGETLRTDVQLVVQEGLGSVSGVAGDGSLLA